MAGAEFSNGRGLITDATGAVRFDTNGQLFHITDRAINGAITIPNRSAPHSGNDTVIATDHAIGSCNASATHIVGMFKVSAVSGTSGVPYNKYFDASGTYVHAFSAVSPGNLSGNNVSLSLYAMYTFLCSGGTVFLRERTRLPRFRDANVGIPQHTITFKLRAGLFT
jgi:hypothetical protein